jgi:hypothetical protein
VRPAANYEYKGYRLTDFSVFATATLALATELHSPAFRVIGAFLAVQVIIHWLFVGIGTLIKAIDGSLFAAPELTGLDDSRAVRHRRSPSPPRVRMRRWTNVGEKPDLEAGLA